MTTNEQALDAIMELVEMVEESTFQLRREMVEAHHAGCSLRAIGDAAGVSHTQAAHIIRDTAIQYENDTGNTLV